MCKSNKRIWCVYIHVNKINNKVYVGITSQKPKRRWRGGSGYNHNKHFTNAIKKYGWDNFEHIVLINELTEFEAKQYEIYLIGTYNSTDCRYGYNMTEGGEGSLGITLSEETRAKMRIARNKNKHIHERKVCCDGIVFDSLKDVSKYLNLPYTNVKSQLQRKLLHKDLYDREFRYEDTEMSEFKMQKGVLTGKEHPNSKRVIYDGIVFNNTKEASEYLGIPNTTIISYLNHNSKLTKELYEKGLHYEDEDMSCYECQSGLYNPKQVICENNIYNTIKECSIYYNENPKNMRRWLSGIRKMPQKYIEMNLRYATKEEIADIILK